MIDSFITTRSKYTDIRINNENKSITKIFNDTFNDNPDYDFYFMANDDIIFHSPLWDIALANKGKISYGNDGIQGINLPTFPMIDGDIVRALGWLQMPSLEKYCGDVIWNFIGKQCNILKYHPEVVIAHDWESCSHPSVHEKDMKAFAEWLPFSFKDCAKVRKVLNG